MSSTGEKNQSRHGRSWASTVFLSPLLWGGALTVGFYALIPHLPTQRELAQRYFCGHPIEYTTAALFFIAISMLALKALGVGKERTVLAQDSLLGEAATATSSKAVDRAAALHDRLAVLPPSLRSTHLVERLRDVCLHVRAQQSAERLEDHLKYLAELAAERLHGSYALIRTITWAIPILGFLGTVMGITIAIANVTPEQLDTSLSAVTGGLAVAFDTTALALALSLVLVFCSFVVERSQQQILADVEEYGIRRIAGLFPPRQSAPTSLAGAEAEAARSLLKKTESLINWQTELWQENLESLRSRWNETLETQRSELDGALRKGIASTLDDHSQQLGAVRAAMLHAFEDAATVLASVVTDQQRAQRVHLDEFTGRLGELMTRVHTETSARQSESLDRVEQACQSVADSARIWHDGLEQAALAAAEQLDELRGQRELLLQVVGEGRQLSELQERLSDNLDAIRTSETFEQTLHTLNAAVNLLAARTHLRAA